MREGPSSSTPQGVRRYASDFHLTPSPPQPTGSWPEPPNVDAPAEPLNAVPAEPAPRVFDLALFESLNDEYSSHPIVAEAPRYDMTSVVDRSRRRLLGIHSRIDLMNKVVLEIGCGSGMEVWHLAHGFASDAWGIDILERRAWPALAGDRVHLVAGDIGGSNGLPSGAFDRVISNTVWEHIEHPRSAFQGMMRVMAPGGLAWIRANLHRGPTASHRYRDIHFPFPHLLFTDDVIAEGLRRRGRPAVGAAWVNRLTWEQYETVILETGFRIRSLRFDRYPIDEAFYARFEDVLGRYPRQDLERGFFTVVLEKPSA